MKEVEIYTDGACSGNPGPGGWGAVLSWRDTEKEMSGYAENTTNNRMELLGPIRAMEALKEKCQVRLYTDSAYVCNAFTQKWLDKWQRNGWMTAKKTPVENMDLWQRLLELTSFHEVHWIKVKGHADNEKNNRCDSLAREAVSAGRKGEAIPAE